MHGESSTYPSFSTIGGVRLRSGGHVGGFPWHGASIIMPFADHDDVL